MNSVRLRQIMLVAMVAAVALASSPVFAQEAAGAGGNNRSVLHLFGAALGLGMIVIGADKITGAVNLPLFLLEGVAILAEVFVLLIVLLNGRP
jgi:hypothetical protein